MASSEWEDEESLVASPFAVHYSLRTFAPYLRGETPRRRPVAKTRQPLEEGRRVWGRSPQFNNSATVSDEQRDRWSVPPKLASFRLSLANVGETPNATKI